MEGQLSEHFHAREFQCKCASRGYKEWYFCGGDSWPHPELVAKLEALRQRIGKPITVTSGCRCAAYNAKVGGAPRSQHKLGIAADITVRGMTPAEVAKEAEAVGFSGIGLYDTFTHVDVRGNRTRWDERKKK